MPSKPSRQRLPFEPSKNVKKPAKTEASGMPSSSEPSPAVETRQPKQKVQAVSPQASIRSADRAIPEAVSRRMVARMATFSGVPLFMAMGTFIASYLIVTNEMFPLPGTAVLLMSLGWFGLSVVGVSYGVLSASWDEENVGSRLGWQEFRLNSDRAWGAIQAGRQQSKARRESDRQKPTPGAKP
ncbi:MAG: PAM68 family protein [Microcoleaceae cyanobacterium]